MGKKVIVMPCWTQWTNILHLHRFNIHEKHVCVTLYVLSSSMKLYIYPIKVFEKLLVPWLQYELSINLALLSRNQTPLALLSRDQIPLERLVPPVFIILIYITLHLFWCLSKAIFFSLFFFKLHMSFSIQIFFLVKFKKKHLCLFPPGIMSQSLELVWMGRV